MKYELKKVYFKSVRMKKNRKEKSTENRALQKELFTILHIKPF